MSTNIFILILVLIVPMVILVKRSANAGVDNARKRWYDHLARINDTENRWTHSRIVMDNVPRATLPNGRTISIQASCGHYCAPRDDEGPYTAFEMGFPDFVPPDYILELAEEPDKPMYTFYGRVPAELIERMYIDNRL